MATDLPGFDAARAADCVGKSILIGMTYVDRAGELVARRQWFGHIVAASRDGIVVRLEDVGDPCVLPPDFRALFPARPGTYRLKESGRDIADPDLVTTWTHRTERDATEFAPPRFSPDWVWRDDAPADPTPMNP